MDPYFKLMGEALTHQTHPVSTLTRLAHHFRRSWHTLAANDNEPMTYWETLQAAILTQDGEG